jgi:GT2 family glycosyltransferase
VKPSCPLASIVLVNWNGLQDTIDCIESCRELTYDNFSITVVDNGSKDGSLEELTARYPQHIIVESGQDLGFAGGCNIGIQRALDEGAEFVWLLNNDTRVDPLALTALVDELVAHPEAAVVGSKIFYYDRPEVLSFVGGGFLGMSGRTYHLGDGDTDRGQYDEPREIEFSTGASMLVRSDVIRNVGLMDDRYFLYWEDVDWCERIRLAGWTVRYAPASLVWHKVGATIPDDKTWAQARYEGRNRIEFYRRVHPRRWPLVALFTLGNAAYLLVRGRPRSAGAMARGVLDALAGRIGPTE